MRDLNGPGPDEAARDGFGRVLRVAWGRLRAWQHGQMSRRIVYLRGLSERMGDEPRFRWRLFAFKCALMLTLVALGQAVGWKDLLDAL